MNHLFTFVSSRASSPRLFHRSFMRMFSSAASVPLRIALIGLPGSGKGTQSSSIERDFGMLPISTGQLLRQIVSENQPVASGSCSGGGGDGGGDNTNEDSRALAGLLARGELIPDALMLRIVEGALFSKNASERGWILDGYPRTTDQARTLQKMLDDHNKPLDRVLYIDVPKTEILSRLGGRLVHPASGRVYNLNFNPPKRAGYDDETGEPLIIRDDDKPETISNRILKYEQQTYPVLDFYQKAGLLTRIPAPSSPEGYVVIKALLTQIREDKMRQATSSGVRSSL